MRSGQRKQMLESMQSCIDYVDSCSSRIYELNSIATSLIGINYIIYFAIASTLITAFSIAFKLLKGESNMLLVGIAIAVTIGILIISVKCPNNLVMCGGGINLLEIASCIFIFVSNQIVISAILVLCVWLYAIVMKYKEKKGIYDITVKMKNWV